MKLLFDTHLLLWSASEPHLLSSRAKELLASNDDEGYFSAISIWEIAIKRALNRPDFQPDPRALRQGYLARGYRELALKSDHALLIDSLPQLHKDLFDRILFAQALSEGMTLVTGDALLAKYPGPVLKV